MLLQDITGAQPSITVLQGKHTTVLEMEFCVLDFLTVTDSPFRSDYNDLQSILVLLTNDLVSSLELVLWIRLHHHRLLNSF